MSEVACTATSLLLLLRSGSGFELVLVLWGVTTITRDEVDRLTWSMGEIYPEAFAELLALVPELEPGGNLPAAYKPVVDEC